MKRDQILLVAAGLAAFFVWQRARAAPAANAAAGSAPALGSPARPLELSVEPVSGIGDAHFPGTGSVLSGKLDWPFLTAVGASNLINRRRPGGITADHLRPVEPAGSPAPAAAPVSSNGGGFAGGGGGGGGARGGYGGGYAIP